MTFADDDTGNGVTGGRLTLAEVRTDDNAFVKGETYVVYALGDSNGNTATAGSDAAFIKAAATNVDLSLIHI